MKPPLPAALVRWLPALAIWSAVLLSLVVGARDTEPPILASGASAPCAPVLLSGSAG